MYSVRVSTILNCREETRVNRELLRGNRRLCPQIIAARLQSRFPGIEVHARKLAICRIRNEQIQTLALADECAAGSRHVNECALLELP